MRLKRYDTTEGVRFVEPGVIDNRILRGGAGFLGLIMSHTDFWRSAPGFSRKLAILTAVVVTQASYWFCSMRNPGKQIRCASREYRGCTELLSPPEESILSAREVGVKRRTVEMSQESYGLYSPQGQDSGIDFSDLEAMCESDDSESTGDICAPDAPLFELRNGVLWQSGVPCRWCDKCRHFQLLRAKHCR